MSEKNDVTVKILDRNYQIKCPADKIHELYNAAKHLDEKIIELRNNDKILSSDSLLAVVALNITHELLVQKKQNITQIENMGQQILQLKEQIESALNEEEK